MDRACLIVNPFGGSGRTARVFEGFRAAGALEGIEVCTTERPGHATVIARRATQEGAKRVIAMGGDGTLNEVVNGLLGSEAVLGIVQVGTGNDYAKTLGIPTDPKEALRLALEGKGRAVDVGIVNDELAFVNVAGVGFDAEVTKTFNSKNAAWRRLPPRVRYYLAIASTFAKFKGVQSKLVIDGESFAVDQLFLLAVGHARFYGAGMMILPDADPFDGLFDTVWASDLRLAELVGLLKKIDGGGHIGHPKVAHRRARRVSLATNPDAPFHLEGDIQGETPADFTVRPSALLVSVTLD
ncbi:MAG: diacylglycerol kinase family lipid kinase [Fimbriimonadaceae bacterium]|nr:diacylglycerol kinase family lipid kinase [Fimbriimonadaceae bacterium]QYK57113.1 MAG: diacylglycerol kinase family lipid kinase [Fimbriimonadaceae bacterium]